MNFSFFLLLALMFLFVCFSTKITCDFNIISFFSNVMERKNPVFLQQLLAWRAQYVACFLVFIAWDIFHFLHCILCQHIKVVCGHISLSRTSHGLDNLHNTNSIFLSILSSTFHYYLLYIDVIFMAFPVSF